MKVSRRQVVASFALLALTAIPVFVSFPFATDNLRAITPPLASEKPGTVAIELAGGSGRDGVYFVPKGTTLAGFLELAGLSTPDGIPVPARSPVLQRATTVLASTDPAAVRTEPMSLSKRLALGIPIDINRLSLAEMRLVPGIGEKTAERILEYRSENGPFRSLEELTQVKGIKEKRLEKLRPCLCVGC